MDTVTPPREDNSDNPMRFAFTKTYKFTSYMKNETPINQFYHTIMPLMALLHKYCTDWEICPELTNEGTIHYHGTLTIAQDKELGYYKYLLPRLKRTGFIKMKNIDNYKKWKQYCTKKQHKYAIALFDLADVYPICENNCKKLAKRIKRNIGL